MFKNNLQFGLERNLQTQGVFAFEGKRIFNGLVDGEFLKLQEGQEKKESDEKKEDTKKPAKELDKTFKEADKKVDALKKDIPKTGEKTKEAVEKVENGLQDAKKDAEDLKNKSDLINQLEQGLSSWSLSSFTETVDGKTIFKMADFQKALEKKLDKPQVDKLLAEFPNADFTNPHTFETITTMANILKTSDSVTWINEVKDGDVINLDKLKTQVEIKEGNAIETDAKDSVDKQVLEALANEDSALLQIGSSIFGKETMKSILSDQGLLGTIARMLLGVQLEKPGAEEMNKGNEVFDTIVKTDKDLAEKYLGKKNEKGELIGGRFTKKVTQLKDVVKNKALKDLIDSNSLSDPASRDEKLKSSAFLFEDLNARFSDHLNITDPLASEITTPTDEKDGEVTLNANTPLEAAAMKRFYASAVPQGFKITDFIKTMKSGNSLDKAKNALSSVVANDPYKDAKADGMPPLVTAKVSGTQVTLKWSQTGILDKLKSVWNTKDDKKETETK